MSTAAQLRAPAPIRDITLGDRPVELGARACHYCGDVYAPAGPVTVARVLDHLNLECPEIRRRSDELVARALWGDR